MVTLSPPTSEARVLFPARPQVGIKAGTRVALIWDGHQFGTLFTFGDNKLFV